MGKNPYTWREIMHRYSNGQISLSGFKQPVGMNLKENNRWGSRRRQYPGRRLKSDALHCLQTARAM